jgi:hypothetical protein
MPTEPKGLCWRDYPIPTVAVNYERAFASETLVPDRIQTNGKVIKPGMTEREINNILGKASAVAEEQRQRSENEQCEYLLALLGQHPDSMHLYKLGELKWQKMAGYFRVSEWSLQSIGTLRIFFFKPSEGASEISYLHHLTLIPVPLDDVRRKKGHGYILTRRGSLPVEWNVENNTVRILNRAGG